jgi:predicted NBD/HSP70 family sugar kinase
MGDIVSLKTRNIVSVLSAVKIHAPITKGEISERTRITAVSAHNIVNDLLEQKVITESDVASKNSFASGRKAVNYMLNPSFGYVIGQRMSRGRIDTALYSFNSECVAYRGYDMPHMTPHETLQKMIDEINFLTEAAKIDRAKMIGGGVTWPGQVDFEAGVIVDLPNVPNYQGMQVKTIMEKNLRFPIYIDNDTKCIVLAIKWMQNEASRDSFIYFASGTYGASAAIIENGKLLRGQNNNAGEIGHVRLMIDGEYASIEHLLTDKNLTEQCRSLLIEAKQLPQKEGEFNLDDVIFLANNGNEIVLEVLNKALNIILTSIDICVKAYDPYCIFLNIEWLRRIPSLYESLVRIFRRQFSSVSYNHLSLKMLDVAHLETLGAATLLFNDFFTNKTTHNSLFNYCGEVLKKRSK